MRSLRSLIAVGLIGMGMALSGCAVGVGNGPARAEYRPTTGQELTDLKKARDNGALSEEEYQTQKKKLLEEGRKR